MADTGTPGRVRVLWLVKGLGPGGAETLLVTHARVGDSQRFSYTAAFALPHKTHLVGPLEEAGVGIRRIPRSPLRWPTAIRRLLVEGGYDVVHVHSPVLAAAARVAVRSIPRPRRPALVATEHNNWRSFHPLTRLVNGLTYSWTDRGFAVSDDVKQSVWRRHRARVEVLIHGVAVDELSRRRGSARRRLRAELGVDDECVLVVTVANMRAQKAYPDLLTAARTVVDESPRAVFAAVGQGPLLEQVTRQRDALGLQGRFHVLGHRADVPDVLAAADLFVLASHWEGLPIAVVEALAAGLPVVSTRVGGIPEAVDSGAQGLLVPPGHPDELAAALARLVEDDELRARMGVAAAERGRRFDGGEAVRRIDDAYAELAAAGGTSRAPSGRSSASD